MAGNIRRHVNRATDEVMREYERLRQQWPQIKQQARQKAQDAASAASKAAIWSFVALLLGVITAAIAGRIGKPDGYDIEDHDLR